MALAHLTTLAEALIAARRSTMEAVRIATVGETLLAELAAKDRIFNQAERIAEMGSWRLTVPDQQV
ncbi:hypothetical protein NY536_27560, partial [Enterobacter hormaechei]|nr:hypothetical protein [Enterobacter hormaechei]